jgi:starch synthase (maltosyl-transferring)
MLFTSLRRNVPVETAAQGRPRISYLHHAHAGSPARWSQVMRRCRDLHFDHIAFPPVFLPGPAADPFLAGDIESANPQFGFGGAIDDTAGRISNLSRSSGLRPIFDFVLDRVDRRGATADSHPDLFIAASEGVADPRVERTVSEAALARWAEPERAEQLLELWQCVLGRILRAGAGGFRFINVQHVPPDTLRILLSELRAVCPNHLALAWMPGTRWSHFRSLEGVGFDGVFCSLPWWDFRSPWLLEEYDALRRIAPVLGCPDAPSWSGSTARLHPSTRVRTYRRSLRFAAAAFDGLLLPISFAGASAIPLCDPDRLDAWESEEGLQDDIVAANRFQARLSSFETASEIRNLTEAGGAVAAVARFDRVDARLAERAFAILVNSSLDSTAKKEVSLDPLPPQAGAPFEAVGTTSDLGTVLAPGEVRIFELKRADFIRAHKGSESPALKSALRGPRLVIERIRPAVDQGRFAVKRLIGETIDVTADVFSDGHGMLAADLLWKALDEREWHRAPMTMGHNDLWRGSFRPRRVGRHVFTIEAWSDRYATLCHAMSEKRKADVDIAQEFEEALEALDHAVSKVDEPARAELAAVRANGDAGAFLSARTQSVMRTLSGQFPYCHEPAIPVEVERPQAGIGAWYELFPRSASATPRQHGSFVDVIERLPAIRAMGFDVLYFPPIHPIGTTHRKGRNNALTAAPDDPGSCYAIGSPVGGHDAILPALGTFEDFIRLRDAAAKQGLELALDFAIQCSPDHPWLKQHPEWFRWQRDGSIRYAENPPKKYEDIVNVEFYAEPPLADLWLGLRDIVLFWVGHGIRIFRVDNPHTKPLPFWEWMIADIRTQHPDVIFLAEAFTRPKMMYRLAKLGFSQSYTYFTWRNTKQELIEYLTQLTSEPVVDFFRPNFFVNTPDINPYYLQTSGRPGFVIRAVLAATLSGLWGMYSGFELCESTPLPGREEYLDSEKYEIKVRDYASPGNIIEEVTRLNRIRKSNPQLQSRDGLTFCPAHNDQVLVYARGLPERRELILVAVTLDPFRPQDATFELPFERLGLSNDGTVTVQDLMRGNRFSWTGVLQRLRLDPHDTPFAIWRISAADGEDR